MPCLHRDHTSLYYKLTTGNKLPVVLLHGWCCNHSFLDAQALHFAREGHSVLQLDFRGHGHSGKPEQSYPITGFTDDVAWICNVLELKQPIIIGHSMGGIVAYDFAARWPDNPSAIIMLDSAVVLPKNALMGLGLEVERLRLSNYKDELRRLVEDIFFLPTDDPERKERILAVMTATPHHVVVSAYEGLGIYDPKAAGRVTVPSLYLAANELSARSDMIQLRSLIPYLHCGQTVGSGHFCQMEVPVQVNSMIDRFLAITH